MSVENFDKLDGAVAFLETATPEDCFFCGKPLSGITAFWHGADGQNVALHPDCGVTLGARLIRDSLNARYISEDGNALAGISPGLVKTS